jgi:G:T-mismatch repair DNA endonuclease (very short patch repair protein)
MEFMTKNEIYFQNMKLIGREKRGLPYNQWTYIFEGDELSGSDFKRGTLVSIKCNGNNKLYEKVFKESWFTKEWYSQSYQSSGERNGMFRKTHSDKVKNHFSKIRKGHTHRPKGTYGHSNEIKEKISMSMTGENNPFYGRTHSQETKELISKNRKGKCIGEDNPFYGKTHSKETIEKITLKGNIWREENPQLSYEAGLKGWQNSIFSTIKYGRKTSIERKVENKLKELGITDFNFSQVLNRKYQYDFRIGKDILLEVHGDYWHGNPKKYGNDKNLKPLNEQQKTKISQDKIKEIYAKENGWKLFVIWEEEINKQDWSILKEILNEI